MIEHRFQDDIQVCGVPGCQDVARWVATILVWPKGMPKNAVRPLDFEFDSPFCNKHRGELQESDFLSAEVWQGIVAWCVNHGCVAPDRATAEVRFRKIVQPPVSRPSVVH